MENFSDVVYNGRQREIANMDTDEILTDRELREMYPDVYYQYVVSPVTEKSLETKETETAVETKTVELRADVNPEPLELSSEEEQWWRDNRPYLFYDNLSAREVYWKKWACLVRKISDYAKWKRHGWNTGYRAYEINFAWQILDEASELVGLAPFNETIRRKVNEDLKDPDVRKKYKRVVEKCIAQDEIVSISVLHYRVHSGQY